MWFTGLRARTVCMWWCHHSFSFQIISFFLVEKVNFNSCVSINHSLWVDSYTLLPSVVALTFLAGRKLGVTEWNWRSIFKRLSGYIISVSCVECVWWRKILPFCFGEPSRSLNPYHQLWLRGASCPLSPRLLPLPLIILISWQRSLLSAVSSSRLDFPLLSLSFQQDY